MSVHAPVLTLTVATDKPYYYPRDNVTIYGNLTLDQVPVTDGVVGIQVKNPSGQTLTFRTETTGTPPATAPYVKIQSIIPCDSSGGQKDSFTRGSLAYFKITVTNYDIDPRKTLVTVSTYYSDNTPFCYSSFGCNLQPQTTTDVILSLPIPQEAILGNSAAYGNAYSGLPESGGWPYCTEASTTFLITDGGSLSLTTPKQESGASTTLQVNGNYNITFKLAPQAKTGNYMIYVTSRYWAEETFNTTTFAVKLLGDFTGPGYPPASPPDGVIDFNDMCYFVDSFIAQYYPPPGTVNPKCDLTGPGYPPASPPDGVIDFNDMCYFVDSFIAQYYS